MVVSCVEKGGEDSYIYKKATCGFRYILATEDAESKTGTVHSDHEYVCTSVHGFASNTPANVWLATSLDHCGDVVSDTCDLFSDITLIKCSKVKSKCAGKISRFYSEQLFNFPMNNRYKFTQVFSANIRQMHSDQPVLFDLHMDGKLIRCTFFSFMSDNKFKRNLIVTQYDSPKVDIPGGASGCSLTFNDVPLGKLRGVIDLGQWRVGIVISLMQDNLLAINKSNSHASRYLLCSCNDAPDNLPPVVTKSGNGMTAQRVTGDRKILKVVESSGCNFCFRSSEIDVSSLSDVS